MSALSGLDVSFGGNPFVTITAIATGGGIVCSRTSGQTPAFFHFSASAITATGTSAPYRDLEFTWDCGDPSGIETFTNPTTGATVNANTAQRGGECVYCYRSAGTYTVTLTIRGKNGSGFTTTAVTQQITVTAYNAAGGHWYFDSVNGNDAHDGLTTSTAKQSLSAINTKTNSGGSNSVHLARGSDWTQDSGIRLFGPLRIDAYGTGANPKVNVNANDGSGTNYALKIQFGGSSSFAVDDIVVSNTDFYRSGDMNVAIYAIIISAANVTVSNIYVDGCNFVSDLSSGNGTLWAIQECGTFDESKFSKMGFWNCSFSSSVTDTAKSTAFFGGPVGWGFFVGGSVSGAGLNNVLDHHLYIDVRHHCLCVYINFGSGPNRNFCINGNWDGDDTPGVLSIASYWCISDCYCSGTSRAWDAGNRLNDVTVTQFDSFVVQYCSFNGLTGDSCYSGDCATGMTFRNSNVWGCDGGIFFGPGGSAALSVYHVYGVNVYRTGGQNNGGVFHWTRIAWTQAQLMGNNIIVDTESTAKTVVLDSFANQQSIGTQIISNQYWVPNDSDAKAWYDGISTPKTFAQWQAFGFDVNGSVANPNWPDPANGVFSTPNITTTGGGSYLSPEELAAIRRYWEELETGRELNRKKREEIEDRLRRTIEAAYDKAMGIEPEAAKAIAAAVPKAALLPAPEIVKSKVAKPTIDWSRVAKDIDAVDRILQVLGKQIDRLDDKAKLSAAQKGKLDRLRKDEQDIELLMMAL